MVTSEQPQVRALYSHAVAGSSSVKVQEQCPCPCESSPHSAAWPVRDFFEKQKNFVLEIFSMVSHGESGAAGQGVLILLKEVAFNQRVKKSGTANKRWKRDSCLTSQE